jgi:HAMP domain-containing protein
MRFDSMKKYQVVCTVSKRKEVTEGPVYQMFRDVLRESTKPCPYFKTLTAFKTALVDHELERANGNKARACRRLEIHRNNLAYMEKILPIEMPPKKDPVSEKVDKIFDLVRVMECEKRAHYGK